MRCNSPPDRVESDLFTLQDLPDAEDILCFPFGADRCPVLHSDDPSFVRDHRNRFQEMFLVISCGLLSADLMNTRRLKKAIFRYSSMEAAFVSRSSMD